MTAADWAEIVRAPESGSFHCEPCKTRPAKLTVSAPYLFSRVRREKYRTVAVCRRHALAYALELDIPMPEDRG